MKINTYNYTKGTKNIYDKKLSWVLPSLLLSQLVSVQPE